MAKGKKQEVQEEDAPVGFVILYENPSAGLEVEAMPMGEEVYPSYDHAVAVIREAEKKLSPEERQTRAFECGDAPWRYYIAEVVGSVEVKYSTQVKTSIKETKA